MATRSLLLLASLAAITVLPDNALAKTHFEGALVIYATAGTCSDYNPVGEQMTVRFQPGGLPGNAADTGFTFLWGGGGYNLTVPGMITGSFKTGTLTGIFDYAGSSTEDIKFTTQTPAVIAETTPSVYADGKLTDFDGMIGCTASFRMSAVKRLN